MRYHQVRQLEVPAQPPTRLRSCSANAAVARSCLVGYRRYRVAGPTPAARDVPHRHRQSGLGVVDLPVPEPGAGQVRIAVEAIGVGDVDALIRSGSLSAWGFREGLVPGSEVAGTVVAVGPDTDASWVGQRVWAFTGLGGGYAEERPPRSRTSYRCRPGFPPRAR
ncbi:alcohol dehydrogenase catalytic domain-containing protein [Kribbella karoonensis]|uniref:Alcohol dehydrogenase-like N-terminal domain-containing protein n=1 Tax=Kribbella karoonensis TaxID=324851 RepID=A0ABP4NK59_9ACTN